MYERDHLMTEMTNHIPGRYAGSLASLKIELASGACSIGSLGGCKMMRARRKYKLDVRDELPRLALDIPGIQYRHRLLPHSLKAFLLGWGPFFGQPSSAESYV